MKKYFAVFTVLLLSLVITACPGGGNTISEGFELEATDVVIAINPAVNLRLGSQAIVNPIAKSTVSIKRQGGFDGKVLLSVVFKPDNVVSELFVPNNTQGNNSVLRLGIDASRPIGSYKVTIKGESGNKTAETTFIIKIKRVEDTIKPKVLNVSPYNFEKGVRSDAKVIFKFSEPMDRASTEAAFGGEKFGPIKITWEDNDKTMIVTPTKGFAYSDTDVAKTHVFLLAASAQDRAGNTLEKETKVTFYTPRTLSAEMYSEKNLDGYIASQNGGIVVSQYEYIVVGDADSNSFVRGFVSFKIKALPEDLISIKKAELSMFQKTVFGKPYTYLSVNNMHLRIGHINYGSSLDKSDLEKALLDSRHKEFSGTAALEPKKVTVTTWVQDDFNERANRSYRSQFRLQFPIKVYKDGKADVAAFYAGEFAHAPDFKDKSPILRIWYYAP